LNVCFPVAFEPYVFDDRALLDLYESDTFIFPGRDRLFIPANKDHGFCADTAYRTSGRVLVCAIDESQLGSFYDSEAKTFQNTR
jgi:hypothetical protein